MLIGPLFVRLLGCFMTTRALAISATAALACSIAFTLSPPLIAAGAFSQEPRDALFELEPVRKATTRTTQPLVPEMRLQFSGILDASERLSLHRCGEPCNTAKHIRTWSPSDLASGRRQVVTIEEPGYYYFWIQRTLPGGEVGPVFGEAIQSIGATSTVRYASGSTVTVIASRR